MFFKQFGGKVTEALAQRYAQSKHWRNGAFQNLEPTQVTVDMVDLPRMIYKQLTNRSSRRPEQPLPIQSFDASAFLNPTQKTQFIWYGHSVVLMRMEGQNILIDPMLGPDTTPIAPFSTKRFSQNTLSLIDDFPEIDLMMLTHDHYDHLDYTSIQKLKCKTKHYFVALGVKRHLVHWGIPADAITEFDWWDVHRFENIQVTFTPTRHFSGRGLTDRFKTLWGGWVLQSSSEKIWFSGDGGYGRHFKEVGQKLGPFDFAFMECGQYNVDWPETHLFPEEAVQAALDAGAQKTMPVHWAGFALSYHHSWHEPAETFVAAAKEKKLNFALPSLGQVFDTEAKLKEKWWTKYS